MKRNHLMAVVLMGAALCFSVPTFAQRGGGGHGSVSSSRSSSSSSHSSYSSSSRSSSSYSSSSRSSSSYSSPSRSSSSYSSPSRPSTPASRPSNVSPSSRPSTVTTSPRNGGATRPSTVGPANRSAVTPSTGRTVNPRTGSTPNRNTTPNGSRVSADRPTAGPTRGGNAGNRGGEAVGDRGHIGTAGQVPGGGYATPGHPGGHMPHAERPIHPAPYFYHPHHHHMMHMHVCFWDPIPFHPCCWHGFWGYCNSYWYDYRPTNVVVVREYVSNNYNADMVDFAVSGDLVYLMVRNGSDNLVQVFDSNDNLLAQQSVSRKYNKLEVDRENGGCWIFKNRDKDPLLFIYADGQLLIYEAD